MDGESCFAAVYEGGVCRGELEELAAELAFACAEICIGGAGKGCAFVKIVDDAVEGEICHKGADFVSNGSECVVVCEVCHNSFLR